MLSPADEIRMKFSDNNFVTPRVENDPYQSTTERPSRKLIIDSGTPGGSITKKAYDVPKITVDETDFDIEEEKQPALNKDEEVDGTM